MGIKNWGKPDNQVQIAAGTFLDLEGKEQAILGQFQRLDREELEDIRPCWKVRKDLHWKDQVVVRESDSRKQEEVWNDREVLEPRTQSDKVPSEEESTGTKQLVLILWQRIYRGKGLKEYGRAGHLT